MNRRTVLFIFGLFSLIGSFSQDISSDNIIFEGEGDGKSYSMIWAVKEKWPSGLEGFVIKRKMNSGDWFSTGNKGGYFPEISSGFDAKTVILGDVVRSDSLQRYFVKKINSEQLKVVNRTDFIVGMQPDKGGVFLLNFAHIQDYNRALISGFGLIDADFRRSTGKYTYGLFPIINGVVSTDPVKILVWKYGERTSCSISTEFSYQLRGVKNKLRFTLPKDQVLSNSKVANFSVVKRTGGDSVILIDRVIPGGAGDEMVVSCVDKEFSKKEYTTYSLIANTIFGNKIVLKDFTIDPSKDIPNDDAKVELMEVQKGESNFPNITWSYIDVPSNLVFEVNLYRADQGFDWELLASGVDFNAKKYLDTSLQMAGQYKYKVDIVYKSGFGVLSSNIQAYYFSGLLDDPYNLNGNFVKINGRKYLELRWGMKDNNAVREYYLYRKAGNDKSFLREAGIDRILKNKVLYQLNDYKARRYEFYITAVNKIGEESEKSNIFEFICPSDEMNRPYITEWDGSEGFISLEWKDSPFMDQDYYEIYVDEKKVTELENGNLKWKSNERFEKGMHSVKLRSVSLTDVESEFSPVKKVLVK